MEDKMSPNEFFENVANLKYFGRVTNHNYTLEEIKN
jgi:hypothetical protein